MRMSVQTTKGDNGRSQEMEKLLLRVGQGDRGAFAQMYMQTREAVYALALSVLHDAQEAQDVAQDVFVQVW